MTIEVRQLLIRSRVGGDDSQAAEEASDDAEQTFDRNVVDALQEEMEQWRRRFVESQRSPRER